MRIGIWIWIRVRLVRILQAHIDLDDFPGAEIEEIAHATFIMNIRVKVRVIANAFISELQTMGVDDLDFVRANWNVELIHAVMAGLRGGNHFPIGVKQFNSDALEANVQTTAYGVRGCVVVIIIMTHKTLNPTLLNRIRFWRWIVDSTIRTAVRAS